MVVCKGCYQHDHAKLDGQTRFIISQQTLPACLKLKLIVQIVGRETEWRHRELIRCHCLTEAYIMGTNSALMVRPGVVSGRITSQFLFQL